MKKDFYQTTGNYISLHTNRSSYAFEYLRLVTIVSSSPSLSLITIVPRLEDISEVASFFWSVEFAFVFFLSPSKVDMIIIVPPPSDSSVSSLPIVGYLTSVPSSPGTIV